MSVIVWFQSNPYALKDSGSSADMGAWTSAGLQPTTGYYPYDPTLAAYGSVKKKHQIILVKICVDYKQLYSCGRPGFIY